MSNTLRGFGIKINRLGVVQLTNTKLEKPSSIAYTKDQWENLKTVVLNRGIAGMSTIGKVELSVVNEGRITLKQNNICLEFDSEEIEAFEKLLLQGGLDYENLSEELIVAEVEQGVTV